MGSGTSSIGKVTNPSSNLVQLPNQGDTLLFPLKNQVLYAVMIVDTYQLPNALSDTILQVPMIFNWQKIAINTVNPERIHVILDTTNESDPRVVELIALGVTIHTTTPSNWVSTYQNLMKVIETSLSDNNGGCLFVQISGHGGQIPDDNGDEADGLDEVIAPGGQIVRDDILTASLTQYESNVTILTSVDTCHSGTMFDQIVLPSHIYSLSSTSDSGSSGEVSAYTTDVAASMSSQPDYLALLPDLTVGVLSNALVRYGYTGLTGTVFNQIINDVDGGTYSTNRSLRDTTSTNSSISWWWATGIIIVIILIILLIILSNYKYYSVVYQPPQVRYYQGDLYI